MSNNLSLYVIFLVVFSIILYVFFLYLTKSAKHSDEQQHHSFDGIVELNEPLPAWWIWLAVISIVFSICYLFLYPGLGKVKGLLNWTSHKECEEALIKKDKLYDPIYKSYSFESVENLSKKLKALKIGKSLFLNNCSPCHGLDAKGGNGFLNLTNSKWLYGGTPSEIKMSITNGRRGKMPPYETIIGNDADIESTALYVLSLSENKTIDPKLTLKGKEKFASICAACHGINAKGNKYIGAPDLTAPQWIYGNSLDNIKFGIKNGRNGIMPAHKDVLSKEQIHILTAYIYSLNKN